MTKKKGVRVSLTYEDIYRLQGRVGRPPVERLAWAVEFAQRDLQDLTNGDWQNIAQELWAFSRTKVWWDGADSFKLTKGALTEAAKTDPTRGKITALLPSNAVIRKYQTEIREILDTLGRRGTASYGPFEKTSHATLYRHGGDMPHLQVFYALFGSARELRKGANLIERFYDLLAEVRVLDRCADEKCGRWFVSGRFDQKFCSNRCQNRAKARRTMAERRAQAKKQKRRRARRKK